MSKLGKKPIEIPKGSSVVAEKGKLKFNGPKGSKEIYINDKIFSTNISKENILIIKPIKKDSSLNQSWGLTRSIINNAMRGVSFGYEKILELSGVGYRAAIKGNTLNLQLGFSHDVNYEIPEGINITVEKQTTIKINGLDKDKVGTVTATIKSYRPVEPYKGKGIKVKGQYVLRKEGKKK